MPFISSSSLIAVTRISSIMLNKRGESEHPCLVPDLKGNTCSFCLVTVMLAVGLLCMAFIRFRYVPSIHTLLRLFIISVGFSCSKFLTTLFSILQSIVYTVFRKYILPKLILEWVTFLLKFFSQRIKSKSHMLHSKPSGYGSTHIPCLFLVSPYHRATLCVKSPWARDSYVCILWHMLLIL